MGGRTTLTWKGLAALGLLAMLVAACDGSGSTGSEQGAEPIRMGLIVPQTGALAGIGASLTRGTESAVKWWNADPAHRRVELETCDDQSTAEGALGCFRRLQSESQVILGPHIFFQYAAVKDLVAEDGPVLLTAVPFSDPPAGSFIFQSQPNIQDIVRAELDFAQQQGYERVATLTANDQPGNLGKQAAAELAGGAGVEIVAQEVFDPQAQNLAPQAERIAGSDPDAVISWVLGPPLVTSLRALHQAGVDAPVMMASGSMNAPLLQQAGSETPPQLLFFASLAFEPAKITDPEHKELVESFSDVYQQDHQQPPDFTAFAAADTVLFPASVAQEEGSSTAAGIRDAMQAGTEIPSLLWGTYSYSADDHLGASGSPYAVLRWVPSSSSWTVAG